MQMMRMELVLGFVVLALGAPGGTRLAGLPLIPPAAQPSPTQTTTRPMVLVELFTSEGCSSCPPADNLLRAIDGKRTKEGSLIVGISEHVNYWDHGGWKDPFDSSTITDRQNDYGQKFHLDSVYTPQMVIDGETQVSGNDPHALLNALQKAEAEPSATLQIVSATVEGDAIVAKVSITGDLPKHGADLFAVVAQDETTTQVTGGENKGKTLLNVSVARNLVKVTKVHEAGETT
ncbi:MAG: DUF1223 domain-containing protein, partial [Acidobacteriaceae bacterium]